MQFDIKDYYCLKVIPDTFILKSGEHKIVDFNMVDCPPKDMPWIVPMFNVTGYPLQASNIHDASFWYFGRFFETDPTSSSWQCNENSESPKYHRYCYSTGFNVPYNYTLFKIEADQNYIYVMSK